MCPHQWVSFQGLYVFKALSILLHPSASPWLCQYSSHVKEHPSSNFQPQQSLTPPPPILTLPVNCHPPSTPLSKGPSSHCLSFRPLRSPEHLVPPSDERRKDKQRLPSTRLSPDTPYPGPQFPRLPQVPSEFLPLWSGQELDSPPPTPPLTYK